MEMRVGGGGGSGVRCGGRGGSGGERDAGMKGELEAGAKTCKIVTGAFFVSRVGA